MLASSEGGSAQFHLVPGEYFVNVAFGRAGVTKKLNVPSSGNVQKQVLILDAGGFVLNAIAGSDKQISANQLKFSVYSSDARPDGERGLVMADIKPNTVVRLNAGTYHVVSEYGNVNAVVRADIQVEAGKLTEATLQHQAAQITLKLVSEQGGEAIADTALVGAERRRRRCERKRQRIFDHGSGGRRIYRHGPQQGQGLPAQLQGHVRPGRRCGSADEGSGAGRHDRRFRIGVNTLSQ